MRSVSDGEAEPYTQLGGGATEVAINYGLIGLLRAVPFHAAQGRCYLPQDVLTDHGINPYALYKGKETEKLPPVIKILLDQFKNAEPKTRYLKAIPAHSNIYKTHIERHDYDVFKMAQSPPPAFKELRVSYKSFL
jgi:phytoene/squalene synthetase